MPSRVLFVAVYPVSQAGTRLRAAAWFDAVRESGLEPQLWTFFGDDDSETWFASPSTATRLRLVVKGVLRAVLLWLRIPRYDVLVVLREALPFASTSLERRAARRSVLVWDVDDALWTSYPRMFLRRLPERLRRSEGKYVLLARLAREVWAGSEVIQQWCDQHAERTWLLPTVPHVDPAVPGLAGREGIAWVGSSSTAEFLDRVLADMAADGGPWPTVHVVGGVPARLHGMDVRLHPWSEQTEREVLATARAGVYPLDVEHPLTQARAGFKAVLYMASGLPAAVTPVAAVAALVRHDAEGLHVRPEESWAQALRLLLDDDERWQRLHTEGHRRALTEYASAVWAPRVAARLQALAAAARP